MAASKSCSGGREAMKCHSKIFKPYKTKEKGPGSCSTTLDICSSYAAAMDPEAGAYQLYYASASSRWSLCMHNFLWEPPDIATAHLHKSSGIQQYNSRSSQPNRDCDAHKHKARPNVTAERQLKQRNTAALYDMQKPIMLLRN